MADTNHDRGGFEHWHHGGEPRMEIPAEGEAQAERAARAFEILASESVNDGRAAAMVAASLARAAAAWAALAEAHGTLNNSDALGRAAKHSEDAMDMAVQVRDGGVEDQTFEAARYIIGMIFETNIAIRERATTTSEA